MKRRLRIAVVGAGRFHVLDLARELDRLGHSVRFYSYVPTRRAAGFGLPAERQVSLLAAAAPMLAWARLAPRIAPGLRERAMNAALNRAVIARLQPCDVIIAMSGVYLEGLEFAKTRFGARVWLERGSRHILSQAEILASLAGVEGPSRHAIERELAGYALADRIVVPSLHAALSFERDPEAHAKLFRNPYGVDLAMFPRSVRQRPREPFQLLNIGAWSRRKGSDLLVEAVDAMEGICLTHVGEVVDRAFPDGARFVHHPPIPQHQLSQFYAHADAFVLPSREDGFGLVLAQALASGLPIVCSDRTGGSDLAHTPALSDRISVFPNGDARALASAVSVLRDRLRNGPPLAPLLDSDREALSWSAYGQRYSAELMRDLGG